MVLLDRHVGSELTCPANVQRHTEPDTDTLHFTVIPRCSGALCYDLEGCGLILIKSLDFSVDLILPATLSSVGPWG
jgi:hypothetical protein